MFPGQWKRTCATPGRDFLEESGKFSPSFFDCCSRSPHCGNIQQAKLSSPSVGLDTQIIAWRATPDAAQFFTPALSGGFQSDIEAIQSNLKTALWAALDRSPGSDGTFVSAVTMMGKLLQKIREHTQSGDENQARMMRYWLMPATGEWSIRNLDPGDVFRGR